MSHLIEHLANEMSYHRARAEYHSAEAAKCLAQLEAYRATYPQKPDLPHDYNSHELPPNQSAN